MAIQQMSVVGPRAEQREPQEKKKDWMERLIEGLQIANGITGVVKDVGDIKGNSLKNQQLTDNAEGILTPEQHLSALKGGDIQEVAPGTPGAMPYRRRGKDGDLIETPLMRVTKKETPLGQFVKGIGADGKPEWQFAEKGGTPVKAYVEPKAPAAPKDRKTRAVTYKDANGNEVTEIVEDIPGAKYGGTPTGGASFQAKVKALKATELQRFDSASMGLAAVKGMTDAYNKGDNTFSLIGDNSFTMASRDFEEALGRMQSGGAIGKEEVARFRAMRPIATDNVDIQKAKLAKLYQEMASRVSNLGFDPNEVLAERAKLPVPSFVDQSPGTATAAPGAKPAAEMTDAELDAELARLKAGKK
jgi:hypothetical protein